MNLSKFLHSLHQVLMESKLAFAIHTKPFPSCMVYHFRPAVLVFTSENIQNIDYILSISKEKLMPLELVCGLWDFFFFKSLQTLLH